MSVITIGRAAPSRREDGQSDHPPIVRCSHRGIGKRAPRQVQRGLPRADAGRGAGIRPHGTQRGNLLLLRLEQGSHRVVMRDFGLVELLLRHEAAIDQRSEPADGARGELAVGERALDLIGRDRRVGFFGEQDPLARIQFGFRDGQVGFGLRHRELERHGSIWNSTSPRATPAFSAGPMWTMRPPTTGATCTTSASIVASSVDGNFSVR